MFVTCRLYVFSFFMLVISGGVCSTSLNQTEVTINHESSAGRRQHEGKFAIKPKLGRKMSKRDMIEDIARAVLRKDNQDLETLRFSCAANEYYDKNTQNCEDCINLCKKFNPKMCQVNCPGTEVALTFKLPQLSEDLHDLHAMHEVQSHEIMTLNTENKETKLNIAQLYVICAVVGILCLICVTYTVVFTVCICKQYKRQKSKEAENSDSNAKFSPTSSFCSLKKDAKDSTEAQEEYRKLIVPEKPADAKFISTQQQVEDCPKSSALTFNQVSPADDESNARKTIVTRQAHYNNQTAQHIPGSMGPTQPKHCNHELK